MCVCCVCIDIYTDKADVTKILKSGEIGKEYMFIILFFQLSYSFLIFKIKMGRVWNSFKTGQLANPSI